MIYYLRTLFSWLISWKIDCVCACANMQYVCVCVCVQISKSMLIVANLLMLMCAWLHIWACEAIVPPAGCSEGQLATVHAQRAEGLPGERTDQVLSLRHEHLCQGELHSIRLCRTLWLTPPCNVACQGNTIWLYPCNGIEVFLRPTPPWLIMTYSSARISLPCHLDEFPPSSDYSLAEISPF